MLSMTLVLSMCHSQVSRGSFILILISFSDLDAQIERCRVLIAERILSEIFERRLKDFLEQKEIEE